MRRAERSGISSTRCCDVRLAGSVGSKGTAIGAPSWRTMPATTFAFATGGLPGGLVEQNQHDLDSVIYYIPEWERKWLLKT